MCFIVGLFTFAGYLSYGAGVISNPIICTCSENSRLIFKIRRNRPIIMTLNTMTPKINIATDVFSIAFEFMVFLSILVNLC